MPYRGQPKEHTPNTEVYLQAVVALVKCMKRPPANAPWLPAAYSRPLCDADTLRQRLKAVGRAHEQAGLGRALYDWEPISPSETKAKRLLEVSRHPRLDSWHQHPVTIASPQTAAEWEQMGRHIEDFARALMGAKPDGPDPDSQQFWYRGESYRLPPIPWRLLCYMWGCDNVEIEKLADYVWEHDPSDPALKHAYRAANQILAEAGYPRMLGMKNGRLRWSD